MIPYAPVRVEDLSKFSLPKLAGRSGNQPVREKAIADQFVASEQAEAGLPKMSVQKPSAPENLLDCPTAQHADASERTTGLLERLQGVGEQVEGLLKPDPQLKIEAELIEVESFEPEVLKLSTPEQFQAKTQDLKARLQAGASLDDIRAEAYAVARRAASVALKKRPFDSQLRGALAMDSGRISQMGTGEGKTLTALMPLYLSSLAGKGSHLITVNDFLAQSGFEQNKPALDLLGVKAGLVLKDSSQEAKREGYAADITYVSNDTLGFDYLGDRMTRDPRSRVQREPFAALVDEVDQILLDEARVPLIISGKLPDDQNAQAEKEYKFFSKIVDKLRPGADFRVELDSHCAVLTELGEEVVANEMALAQAEESGDAKGLETGLRLRSLMVEIGKLEALEQPEHQAGLAERLGNFFHPQPALPEEAQIMFDAQRDEQERLQRTKADLIEQKESLQQEFPGVNLYSEEGPSRVSYLQNALAARGLYKLGVDYTVENGQVQIVDEFKGRISEGRRFSNGLHQALEAKEEVAINPETRTVASITYPNLLKRYERLAGMTGTAKSSENEFNEVLGLEVVEIAPNLESKRVDHPDLVFATMDDKLKAVPALVQKCFEEGVPVLVGTRSVAMNKYVAKLLEEAGIPNQALNAEDVKTNTPEENLMIADAGLSGAVTVATNMAGRGVDIKPDKVNYKKLYLECLARREKGLEVEVRDAEEAEKLAFWFNLSSDPSQQIPYQIATGDAPEGQPGQVVIRVGQSGPSAANVLRSQDFPGKKLVVLALDRNLDERIDDQLKGRAGRQGAPGESRFLLSLDDDLLRVFGEEELARMRLLVPPNGVEGDPTVGRWVGECQARATGNYVETRLNSAKYDKVANHQREIVWAFRDSLVDSRPDINPVDPPLDFKTTSLEWIAQSWTEALEAELGGKKHPKETKLNAAMEKLTEQFGYRLDLEGADAATKEKPLNERISEAVNRSFDKWAAQLPPGSVPQYQWDCVLGAVDDAWIEHLEDLESLKDNANLETYAGKDPFDAYQELTVKAFDKMWKRIHADIGTRLFPQMEKDAAFWQSLPK